MVAATATATATAIEIVIVRRHRQGDDDFVVAPQRSDVSRRHPGRGCRRGNVPVKSRNLDLDLNSYRSGSGPDSVVAVAADGVATRPAGRPMSWDTTSSRGARDHAFGLLLLWIRMLLLMLMLVVVPVALPNAILLRSQTRGSVVVVGIPIPIPKPPPSSRRKNVVGNCCAKP